MAELKSGDLAIVGSDAYADYRTQLIDWAEYNQTVAAYGQMLGFPTDGAAFTAHVQAQLSQQAHETDAAFPALTGVHIENGEPVVGRTPRRPDPPGLKNLEDRLAATVKPVNILDVIRYTEHWLHWMQPFGPISGHDSKLENPTERYVATVFCYGCNLGPTQTARGITGLDRKQVAWPNQRHITEDALEEAIQIVINSYQRGALPKHWGTGKTVSADGTKWDLYEQNLLAEYHIRYGGYGGIGYYHVSDTYIALFSHFIPCGVWEAVYILDGLLKNESEIQPDTIHADTQGQSAPVFALAYLLGISLMPRIRNWKRLTFFRPKRTEHYTHIDAIFSDAIDWNLIETHLPDMLRVVLSIKTGRITPSMILRRLSTYNQHNRLYQAFRELGRAVRTHFLLLYLRDAELRSTIHAALNKSEAFNNFVQWIAFGGEGVLASNDRAVQRKIIKYNHLVANCVIFYNAVVISQALYELHASGVVIDADALAAISPLITEHIDRFGRYPSNEALPPPFDEAVFHGAWLPAPLIGQNQSVPVPAKPTNLPQHGQLGFEGLAPL
jgi:TnpA family transposase